MHFAFQFMFLLTCKCDLSKSPSDVQTQYWYYIRLIVIHLIKLITNSSISLSKSHRNHPLPLYYSSIPLHELITVEILHPSLSTPARSSISQLTYIQLNRLHLLIVSENLIDVEDTWPLSWIGSQHYSD